MMKADNYRLIAEVAQRRPLWDTTIAVSDRRDELIIHWACVAHIMKQDVATCKKRFKGLRDSYRAEVRKIQQKRISMSQWPYFRCLEFMRHIFDPQQLVPFPPEPFDFDTELSDEYTDGKLLDEFTIDVDVDNDDSVDFEIMDDIFKRESSEHRDSGSDPGSLIKPLSYSPMPRKSDLDLSPRLHFPPKSHQPPRLPPPSKRIRRRKTSSSYDGPPTANGHFNQSVTTTPTSAADTSLKDDADYSFLVSLLPHMKSLSNMGNLKFRMEISRTLVEIKKEETPAPASPQTPQPSRESVGGTRRSGGGLPRLTPAPDSSYANLQEKSAQMNCLLNSSYLNVSNHSNLATSDAFVDSSMIECDVKIEEEQLI
ncbi:uncharacterized protein [Drosophila bipectinata]|uniref:uncharacterized protein n=1 Tax=Drosophila bipectinata TaxID=42026 RepID=UPI001C8B01AF|nr:uncharacterized protein LOC108125815 [Drosophila bipectinata]